MYVSLSDSMKQFVLTILMRPKPKELKLQHYAFSPDYSNPVWDQVPNIIKLRPKDCAFLKKRLLLTILIPNPTAKKYSDILHNTPTHCILTQELEIKLFWGACFQAGIYGGIQIFSSLSRNDSPL